MYDDHFLVNFNETRYHNYDGDVTEVTWVVNMILVALPVELSS